MAPTFSGQLRTPRQGLCPLLFLRPPAPLSLHGCLELAGRAGVKAACLDTPWAWHTSRKDSCKRKEQCGKEMPTGMRSGCSEPCPGAARGCSLAVPGGARCPKQLQEHLGRGASPEGVRRPPRAVLRGRDPFEEQAVGHSHPSTQEKGDFFLLLLSQNANRFCSWNKEVGC